MYAKHASGRLVSKHSADTITAMTTSTRGLSNVLSAIARFRAAAVVVHPAKVDRAIWTIQDDASLTSNGASPTANQLNIAVHDRNANASHHVLALTASDHGTVKSSAVVVQRVASSGNRVVLEYSDDASTIEGKINPHIEKALPCGCMLVSGTSPKSTVELAASDASTPPNASNLRENIQLY